MKDRLIMEEKRIVLQHHAEELKYLANNVRYDNNNFDKAISEIFEVVHRINDIIKELAFVQTK